MNISFIVKNSQVLYKLLYTYVYLNENILIAIVEKLMIFSSYNI